MNNQRDAEKTADRVEQKFDRSFEKIFWLLVGLLLSFGTYELREMSESMRGLTQTVNDLKQEMGIVNTRVNQHDKEIQKNEDRLHDIERK